MRPRSIDLSPPLSKRRFPLKEYRRKVYYLTLTQYLPVLYSRLDAIAASTGLELGFPLADSPRSTWCLQTSGKHLSRGGNPSALFLRQLPTIPSSFPNPPAGMIGAKLLEKIPAQWLYIWRVGH